MRRLLYGALLVLAGSVTARSASAQTCAMLPPGEPPGGHATPPPSMRLANDTVMQALATSGVAVIPSDDAQRRMVGEPFAECNDLECGGAVVRSLGVDFVVLVTVWAPRGTPTSVVVALVGPEDSAAGDAPVDRGDVAGAALRALTVARQRWQASQMGFVEVTSRPSGAAVEVDGRRIGETPIRHLVAAGERRVRVHLDGYETVEQTVRIEPTREHPVEITLQPEGTSLPEPEPEPMPEPPRTRVVPDDLNLLIGTIALVAGAGALVVPVAHLALAGQCADAPAPGVCRSEYYFGPGAAAATAIAGAALITGAVFLFGQPLQTTVTVAPGAASIGVQGSF